MELSDLLVSYKRVDAPTKPIPTIPIIEQWPIYQEIPTVKTEEPSNQVTTNPTTEYYISSVQAPGFRRTSYRGLAEFNRAYDEVEASNPEAKKYRRFLTQMAEKESGFNSSLQNRAGAPAYGYFQFMQDGKKYNNIRRFAGTDVETFRNNPKLQIEAAIKLAKSFEKGFDEEDLKLASEKGYSMWGLLGGAWLAGNGGVRKFLRGQGNPSDRHWSKEGKGTDVATRIKAFNFKKGGIVKYQNPAGPIKSPSQIAQNNLSKQFPVNWENANWLHNYFKKNLGYNTSLSILSSILPESGADPHKKQLKGGPGRGLVQWGFETDRYNHMKSYKMKGKVEEGVDPELQRQAEYIVNTVKDPQKTGEGLWHHGGAGSGYKSAEDARKRFISARTPASQKARAFSLGYVRPKGGIKEATRRASFVASLDSVYNSKYK